MVDTFEHRSYRLGQVVALCYEPDTRLCLPTHKSRLVFEITSHHLQHSIRRAKANAVGEGRGVVKRAVLVEEVPAANGLLDEPKPLL